MRKLLVATVLVLIASPALAAPLEMICKNPHQEYLVTFDPQGRTLVLNKDTDATRYTVVSAKGSIVTGRVGRRSGLDFVADFGSPQLRLYSAGALVQTDACHDMLPDLGL